MFNRRECLEMLAGSALMGGCRGFNGLFGASRKLALNPSTIREFKLPLLEQVKVAAKAGFGGIEPWLCDLHRAKADGTLAEVVAVARGEGVEFVNGIAFGTWSHRNAAKRAVGLDETRRDMEILSAIGCPNIAASMCGIHAQGSPMLTPEEIAERYAELLDIGKRMGVRPLLEYWGHSLNLHTPEDALTVLRLVNRADAAMLPDVFHTWKGGGDFATIGRCKPSEIPVLHVNDFPVGADRAATTDAQRVWPGDGGADWGKVFAAVDASGADPWLSIELFNKSYQQSTPEWTATTGCAKVCGVIARGRGGALTTPACGLKLGVQMWSVNDIWKKNPADAFRRLKKMGYAGVQSFGFYGMDWDELEKMLDGEGLQIVDTPFYMQTLKDDEGKFLAFCERFKLDFAYEPWAEYKTGAEWLAHAQELKGVKERLAKRGIRVGYHNHQHDTKRLADGISPMEAFFDAGLNFELDVGHFKLAGGDPVEWLNKLPGRVPSIHAKPGGGNSIGGVGDVNDWPAILGAASAIGVKWAIVECESRLNTFDDVEASINFLKGR